MNSHGAENSKMSTLAAFQCTSIIMLVMRLIICKSSWVLEPLWLWWWYLANVNDKLF